MTFRVPEVISDHTGTLDACSVPMIRAELQLEVFSASILLLLWICFRLWNAMMECLETESVDDDLTSLLAWSEKIIV